MAAEQFDDFDSFPNLVTMFFARARASTSSMTERNRPCSSSAGVEAIAG